MEFSTQEKQIIVEVIGKVQVSPLQGNAVEILAVLQSIIKKLSTPEKEEKKVV